MRLIKVATLFLALAVLTMSCNGNNVNNTTGASDTIGEKLNAAAKDIGAAANKAGEELKQATTEAANKVRNTFNINTDSSFVANAYADNNKELTLIETAISKATSKEIKTDARKMQADHKILRMKLKAYAADHSYLLPAPDNDNTSNRIDNMANSSDWDKSWVDEMVNEYNGNIAKYERAKDNVKDPELRNLILNMLPLLRSHYDMMKGLQDRMSVK